MKLIKKLIKEQAKRNFVKSYESKDYEVLGVIIAKHFKWNGREIVKCFLEALEDANFHTLRSKIKDLWNETEARHFGGYFGKESPFKIDD